MQTDGNGGIVERQLRYNDSDRPSRMFDGRGEDRGLNGVNLYLPDLVLWDQESNTIVLVEGKKLDTLAAGLEEIQDYDSIETEYIRPKYPDCDIVRGVSIFGGYRESVPARGVIFYLNYNGKVVVSDDAPTCIKRVFSHV